MIWRASVGTGISVALIDTQAWPTQAGACQAVVEYIARYNGTRLHSTLGYRSPADFKNDDHGKLRNVA